MRSWNRWPLPEKLRSLIVRCHRSVLLKQQASVGMELGGALPQRNQQQSCLVDIHFGIIQKDERSHNGPDCVLTQQGETRRSDSQRQRLGTGRRKRVNS